MRCGICGARVRRGKKTCPKCGAPLPDAHDADSSLKPVDNQNATSELKAESDLTKTITSATAKGSTEIMDPAAIMSANAAASSSAVTAQSSVTNSTLVMDPSIISDSITLSTSHAGYDERSDDANETKVVDSNNAEPNETRVIPLDATPLDASEALVSPSEEAAWYSEGSHTRDAAEHPEGFHVGDAAEHPEDPRESRTEDAAGNPENPSPQGSADHPSEHVPKHLLIEEAQRYIDSKIEYSDELDLSLEEARESALASLDDLDAGSANATTLMPAVEEPSEVATRYSREAYIEGTPLRKQGRRPTRKTGSGRSNRLPSKRRRSAGDANVGQ